MAHSSPRASVALPDPAEVEANIQAWRGVFPQLDEHLVQGIEPARALRHLGLFAWSGGQPALAVVVLKSATALMPDDPWVLSDLAGAHYACGEAQDARNCLILSLELDDRQPARWLSLAGIHREVGEDADAELAFINAIQLDPSLHDAWVGLGILHFQNRQLPQAVDALRRGILLGNPNPLVRACLGEALYLQGDIAGALEAYGAHVRMGMSEPKVLQKYAFVVFLDALIKGPLEEALAHYRATAGEHAEDAQLLTQNAFHALSGYGYTQAAIRCGEAHLEYAPEDPIPRYLMAALTGAPTTRAPVDYLVSFFDQFADTFDHKLVEVLQYRVPQKLQKELVAMGAEFETCLDAGCGTGLAGPLLHRAGRRLIGVDLSSRMLAKAAEREVYAELVQAEIHDYLENSSQTFDLILAADALIYTGDLGAFMTGAARCLNADGLLAFSIETTDVADFNLLPSGRFAHRPDYIRAITSGLFTIEKAIETQIRLDALGPAMGMMLILRKQRRQ